MRVTHSMIGEVISHLFGIPATVDDEGVTFGIEAEGGSSAQVIMQLFEAVEETEEETGRQGLQITLFFDNPDETRLDLSPLGFEDALLLCYNLQEGLDWGTLELVSIDGDDLTVSLSRNVDINLRDIHMAAGRDLYSEFFRTIGRLVTKWELLCPVFQTALSGQVSADQNKRLDRLLYETGGTA